MGVIVTHMSLAPARAVTEERIADILFAVQLLGATLYCGSQTIHSLSDVHGVSIIQFALAAAFVAFNFVLAIGAHHAKPGRRTVQALFTYVVWLIGSNAIVVAVLLNGTYRWSVQDIVILAISAGLAVTSIWYSWLRRLSIKDPIIIAFLAISSKSIPQVFLAWKILEEGGSGIPALALAIGHCTILVRLGQIWFMVRESGWERNRFWLAISEGAAEVTWIIVTVAWLMML